MCKNVRTALIKAIDPQDVSRTHLLGPANGDVVVRDGNDGWLPVPGESKPVVQTHSCNERLTPQTILFKLLRRPFP